MVILPDAGLVIGYSSLSPGLVIQVGRLVIGYSRLVIQVGRLVIGYS